MSNDIKPLTTERLLAGLCFPESPRWHQGELWFSDMVDRKVASVDLARRRTDHFEVPAQPSGLGWQPDGRLLVVSMHDRRLMRWDGRQLELVADLSRLAHFHCNDMLVDRTGAAYIGNFGYDNVARATPRTTVLIRVEPDGSARAVADELMFPNGMAITEDGTTLLVAETMAERVSAYRIDADGGLSARRSFARIEGSSPDGLCLDAAGAIWMASPIQRAVLRIEEGGRITHRIACENQALACMLGGPERRTLFVLSAPLVRAEKARAMRAGAIDFVEVEVAGAGLP